MVERLEAAATGGRDGVLHVVGEPGGLVYLAGGRVSLVQTPAAPGVDLLIVHRTREAADRFELLDALATSQGRDAITAEARRRLLAGEFAPLELDVVHQQAVADAAFALLAIDGTFVRSRFFRGERPWTQLSDPVTVDDLIAEAARRRRYLADQTARHAADQTDDQTDDRAAGIRPDSRPLRTDRLPETTVRLTAAQWDLVVHADGARTTTELAWLLGRGVFATTLEVSRLERLGLLELTKGRPQGRAADHCLPSTVRPDAATDGEEGDATSLVPARGGPHG